MQSKYHQKLLKPIKHFFIRHLQTTFVGVQCTCGMVDIHWGGLLVNDWKVLTIYSLLFYLRSVGQYQGQRHYIRSYQLPNIDKANADLVLRDRLKNFWLVFVNFGSIICIYFNCCQHTMFIEFVIYFLKYSPPPSPPIWNSWSPSGHRSLGIINSIEYFGIMVSCRLEP